MNCKCYIYGCAVWFCIYMWLNMNSRIIRGFKLESSYHGQSGLRSVISCVFLWVKAHSLTWTCLQSRIFFYNTSVVHSSTNTHLIRNVISFLSDLNLWKFEKILLNSEYGQQYYVFYQSLLRWPYNLHRAVTVMILCSRFSILNVHEHQNKVKHSNENTMYKHQTDKVWYSVTNNYFWITC